jgi:hypothetical protein
MTVYCGKTVGGAGDPLPITGSGQLLGLMISHSQGTVQTFAFYDNPSPGTPGDLILVVHLSPNQCPFYVMFPRHLSIRFSTGLSAQYPANAGIMAWVVTH